MDEDRLKGVGKQVSGLIKEAVGKVTGDIKTQAEVVLSCWTVWRPS